MNKTLKNKKGIGIVAIILGALRCASNAGMTTTQLQTLRDEVNGASPNADQNVVSDLREFISMTETYLPFVIATTFAILMLGIVLLYVEKGVPVGQPMPKSRKVNCILLGFTAAYALSEIFYIFSVSQLTSIADEIISVPVIVGSLSFVGVLLWLCISGMIVGKKSQAAVTNDQPTATTDGNAQ